MVLHHESSTGMPFFRRCHVDIMPCHLWHKFGPQQRFMSPKEGKDHQRPPEHLKMCNKFMCQLRPVRDNDPTILIRSPRKGS
ncbi:hypothetical protein TNCV_2902031 [Trichonephila clavipes]|nr:hypothetical protein TNCV_2902031 [Trichonephila clavipes]